MFVSHVSVIIVSAHWHSSICVFQYIGTLDVPRPSSRVEIVAAMRRIRVSMQEWSKHKQLAASETMSLGKVVSDDKHVSILRDSVTDR